MEPRDFQASNLARATIFMRLGCLPNGCVKVIVRRTDMKNNDQVLHLPVHGP